jgi:hypothetical protein
VIPSPDFSLVLGGPLYQLLRRTRLSGTGLELLRRRVLVLAGVTWLPLVLLAAADGRALDGSVIPFLYDVEVHVRYLVALPILVATEVLVHRRIRLVVARFAEEGIVLPDDLPAFQQAIAATLRARDSVTAEAVLLVAIYTIGLWLSWEQIALLGAPSWYATPSVLTPAGGWYVFVSIPVFQFLLLRWYYRFALWFRFLWRVSRLPLRLRAVHPDRAAGLGFLGGSLDAFAPILLAQSALVAGQIASLILYAGRSLTGFKAVLAGFLAFFIAASVGPLTLFAPSLRRVRSDGLGGTSQLIARSVDALEDRRWPDLRKTYRAIEETRLAPFGWSDVARLAAAAAVPFLPLMLVAFSMDDLVDQLIEVLL